MKNTLVYLSLVLAIASLFLTASIASNLHEENIRIKQEIVGHEEQVNFMVKFICGPAGGELKENLGSPSNIQISCVFPGRGSFNFPTPGYEGSWYPEIHSLK